MMNKHVKSPCCNVPVRRFGKRRRQCIRCKKTWRIRQKKRGRNQIRPNKQLFTDVLEGKTTIVGRARKQNISPDAIEKRCERTAKYFLSSSENHSLPPGKLILIVDGLWTYVHKEGRYTLYLMAVRGRDGTAAHFLDPVLLPGRENLDDWRRTIETIPNDARQRICAMVSDGLRGLKKIAEENGWAFQRCQFHLLAWFQKRHGQYFQRGKTKWMRDAILAYVQTMLETTDQKKLHEFRKELEIIIRHPDCPRYLAMRVREFLRTIDDFRTYLRYPKLHLPTTSNTVETMIRLLRGLLSRIRGARTPETFLKWTTSYVRHRKTITCNGKKSTKFIR